MGKPRGRMRTHFVHALSLQFGSPYGKHSAYADAVRAMWQKQNRKDIITSGLKISVWKDYKFPTCVYSSIHYHRDYVCNRIIFFKEFAHDLGQKSDCECKYACILYIYIYIYIYIYLDYVCVSVCTHIYTHTHTHTHTHTGCPSTFSF
jgi:hypothetical protein